MQNLFKEYFSLCSFCIGVYTFYSTGIHLIKYFKKFLKKMKFFQKFNENSGSNIFFSENYVIVRGRAYKIFSRDSEEIDSSIIISESNSTYYEDFFLLTDKNKEKFYIQPDNKTKFYDLNFQYLRQKIDNKFFNFLYKIMFRKSQVLRDGDFIFVFGKFQFQVEKNSTKYIKVMNEFRNLISIRPKEIVGSSYKYLINKVKYDHIGKIMHQSFIFLMCGVIIFFQFRNYFSRIKNFFSRFKRRTSIQCKDCGVNLCNVMCEKCSNLTQFCDICYLKLQDKIDGSEISLEDIRCKFCDRVLDYCQKFTYD